MPPDRPPRRSGAYPECEGASARVQVCFGEVRVRVGRPVGDSGRRDLRRRPCGGRRVAAPDARCRRPLRVDGYGGDRRDEPVAGTGHPRSGADGGGGVFGNRTLDDRQSAAHDRRAAARRDGLPRCRIDSGKDRRSVGARPHPRSCPVRRINSPGYASWRGNSAPWRTDACSIRCRPCRGR